jgi:hypothetical protein
MHLQDDDGEWNKRAKAEAAARAALQSLLANYYGATIDKQWLQGQGVDVDHLLPETYTATQADAAKESTGGHADAAREAESAGRVAEQSPETTNAGQGSVRDKDGRRGMLSFLGL